MKTEFEYELEYEYENGKRKMSFQDVNGIPGNLKLFRKSFDFSNGF